MRYMDKQSIKKILFAILLILTAHGAWALDEENDEGFGGIKGKITTSDNNPAALGSG